MGHPELASADQVFAFNHRATRTLYLVAHGSYPDSLHRDAYFVRDTVNMTVDPVFSLNWIVEDGNGSQVLRPYTVDQKFPNLHFEMAHVVVRSKQFPDGKLVGIIDIGSLSEMNTSAPMTTFASLPAARTNGHANDDSSDFIIVPLFVQLGEPFDLSERLPLGGQSFGMIDTQYDDKSLQMINASYRTGHMYWKLKGIRQGYTTFIIRVWTQPGPGISRKVVISIEDPPVHTQAAAAPLPASMPAAVPASLPAPVPAQAPEPAAVAAPPPVGVAA